MPRGIFCFANSGGIFLGDTFHGAIVRPGIALYGGMTDSDVDRDMKPVVRLDIRVIQTHTVQPGTLIGYGGAYRAETEMRLATLAAGYADGLPRSLGERGAVYACGKRLPIVGRVSMDLVTVDVTDLPGPLAGMDLICSAQSVDRLAEYAGTIGYEILTGLGSRYVRHYVGG